MLQKKIYWVDDEGNQFDTEEEAVASQNKTTELENKLAELYAKKVEAREAVEKALGEAKAAEKAFRTFCIENRELVAGCVVVKGEDGAYKTVKCEDADTDNAADYLARLFADLFQF